MLDFQQKFNHKIVTQNHNTNLYHHLHHKNVTIQAITLHFTHKNSGKNGIAHHHTIIHKCNTKIVTQSHNTNLDVITTIWTHNSRQDHTSITSQNILQNHINILHHTIKHSHYKHIIYTSQYTSHYTHNHTYNLQYTYIYTQLTRLTLHHIILLLSCLQYTSDIPYNTLHKHSHNPTQMHMILYLLITLNHVYFNHNSTIINATNKRILALSRD